MRLVAARTPRRQEALPGVAPRRAGTSPYGPERCGPWPQVADGAGRSAATSLDSVAAETAAAAGASTCTRKRVADGAHGTNGRCVALARLAWLREATERCALWGLRSRIESLPCPDRQCSRARTRRSTLDGNAAQLVALDGELVAQRLTIRFCAVGLGALGRHIGVHVAQHVQPDAPGVAKGRQ